MKEYNLEGFERGLFELGITLSEEQKTQFLQYYELLVDFGRYQDERSVSFLLHHAEEEKEGFWELQNACISALAVYPGPQTLEILKKETSSKNWYVRYNAAKSLAVLNTDRDALADILQGNDRYAKEMLEYQLDEVKVQRGAGL